MSTKDSQIEWRRSQVISMRAKGLNQTEIARELQVSKQLISKDVIFIRQQAKEHIRDYVSEKLPEQYEICLAMLDIIIKRAVHIMDTAEDNEEVFEALELLKRTHFQKLSLLSDASLVENALNFIRRQKELENGEHSGIYDLETPNVLPPMEYTEVR